MAIWSHTVIENGEAHTYSYNVNSGGATEARRYRWSAWQPRTMLDHASGECRTKEEAHTQAVRAITRHHEMMHPAVSTVGKVNA